MRVALVTDLPSFASRQAYLDELRDTLFTLGVESDIHLIGAGKPSSLGSRLPVSTSLRAIMDLRSSRRYDLLHVQFTFPLGTVYSFARPPKVPVLIHTHGYDVFTVKEVGYGLRRLAIGRALTKLTWRLASGVIAVCEESLREIRLTVVDQDKTHLLHNGVNAGPYSPKRPPSELVPPEIRESSGIVFLCVANFVHVKNHTRLLAAFDLLAAERRESRLVLVGDGPLRSKLQQNAGPGVLFLGEVPKSNMPSVYATADAFVLASLSEAHPWSLLEAMSCGLPSIASNVGGIPETLENGDSTFDPLSVREIHGRLRWISDMSSEERGALGEANRSKVLRNYTIQKHAEKLVKIYERYA